MKTKLETLIEEAKLQAEEHPSKDARWFANSVHDYLTQRTWVGLTDEDIYSIIESNEPPNLTSLFEMVEWVAKAIEAKLKEKNNG